MHWQISKQLEIIFYDNTISFYVIIKQCYNISPLFFRHIIGTFVNHQTCLYNEIIIQWLLWLLIQTYLNQSKPIWTNPNLSEPIRTYLNLSEPIWTYSNLSYHKYEKKDLPYIWSRWILCGVFQSKKDQIWKMSFSNSGLKPK